MQRLADLVPTEAGILVQVDDPAALAAALRRLITEPELRRRLAEGARLTAQSLPRWQDTAALVASALSRIENG